MHVMFENMLAQFSQVNFSILEKELKICNRETTPSQTEESSLSSSKVRRRLSKHSIAKSEPVPQTYLLLHEIIWESSAKFSGEAGAN